MTDAPVALITGAGKGIGRAITLRMAALGYRVAVYSRTATDLESLAGELGGGTDSLLSYPGDVADADAVGRCVEDVEKRWGKIDLLVNNAGFGIQRPVHELKVAEWDSVIAANLRGTFLFTRAVLPGMIRRQDGIIVNVASIAGKNGFSGGTAYSAAKHGVMGFTDSLWREVREHNIRICAICPGSVDTHFFGPGVGTAGREHMMRAEDIAEAVAYVARQPERLFVKEIELRVTHPK